MNAAFTGGCQCGAVRYAAEGPPDQSDICHCRMCQRATGAPAVAFAQFAAAKVAWSGATRKLYRSSNVASRGFCPECGTPLSFEYDPAGTIGLSLCSLDDPEAIVPTSQAGIESRRSWLDPVLHAPGHETESLFEPDVLARFESKQSVQGGKPK